MTLILALATVAAVSVCAQAVWVHAPIFIALVDIIAHFRGL